MKSSITPHKKKEKSRSLCFMAKHDDVLTELLNERVLANIPASKYERVCVGDVLA